MHTKPTILIKGQKAIKLLFISPFLLLLSCTHTSPTGSIQTNKKPIQKSELAKTHDTIRLMQYNNPQPYFDSIYLFSKTGKYKKTSIAVLKKDDVYYASNDFILNKEGIIIPNLRQDTLKIIIANDSTDFIIQWNPAHFYLNPAYDELFLLAKNEYGDNMNQYITGILVHHNAALFLKFITRYTFNQPATEQYPELLFPFATSLSDSELHHILTNLHQEYQTIIATTLLEYDGTYPVYFKKEYLERLFPVTYQYLITVYKY